MDFQKSPINAAGQQFIRVREQSWNDDGFVAGQRVGFLEVKPEKADAVMKGLSEGVYSVTLGTRNRQTGLHEVSIIRVDATTAAAAPAEGQALRQAVEA